MSGQNPTLELSTKAQRQRILSHLQAGQPLTTLQARHDLNVMHPGGRVMELRRAGYNIATFRREDFDTAGRPHKVAYYVLLGGQDDD